jgi:hypothetical protein
MAFAWSLISGETRAFRISVQFTGPNVTQKQAPRYPAYMSFFSESQQFLCDDFLYTPAPFPSGIT